MFTFAAISIYLVQGYLKIGHLFKSIRISIFWGQGNIDYLFFSLLEFPYSRDREILIVYIWFYKYFCILEVSKYWLVYIWVYKHFLNIKEAGSVILLMRKKTLLFQFLFHTAVNRNGKTIWNGHWLFGRKLVVGPIQCLYFVKELLNCYCEESKK